MQLLLDEFDLVFRRLGMDAHPAGELQTGESDLGRLNGVFELFLPELLLEFQAASVDDGNRPLGDQAQGRGNRGDEEVDVPPRKSAFALPVPS